MFCFAPLSGRPYCALFASGGGPAPAGTRGPLFYWSIDPAPADQWQAETEATAGWGRGTTQAGEWGPE